MDLISYKSPLWAKVECAFVIRKHMLRIYYKQTFRGNLYCHRKDLLKDVVCTEFIKTLKRAGAHWSNCLHFRHGLWLSGRKECTFKLSREERNTEHIFSDTKQLFTTFNFIAPLWPLCADRLTLSVKGRAAMREVVSSTLGSFIRELKQRQRGNQREYSSKPLKHSIVKRI